MPLEESVALDVSEAQTRIDDLGSALTSAAQSFATALDEATQVLSSIRIEQVDASVVTSSIDEAVASADTAVNPTIDAAGITTGIDEAVSAAGTPQVPVDADTTAIGPEIDDAVSSVSPTPLEIPVDAGEITDSIDAALSSVDTSGLETNLGDVTNAANSAGAATKEAASNLELIGPAAGFAAGEVGNLSDIVSKITPGMAGAALATGGLVEAGKKLFDAALEQDTALSRLREQFGALASEIEHINFGGINEDLSTLAVRTGANVDGLRNFAASFAQLGKSSGDSVHHIADVAQQIILLAERASVLNPNLGTADELVQRLSTSLARGGRFLAAYGISLSTAQINAAALAETGKTTTAQLTIYEKEVAGATLATKQLGDSLGKDIDNGAKKAIVQMRSLSAAFEETIKAAGRPLIQPTIQAFADLEPVLARLALLLGTGLATALRAIEPLLELVDVGLRAIESPAGIAVAALLAFGPVSAILTDVALAMTDFAIVTVTSMGEAAAAAVSAEGVIGGVGAGFGALGAALGGISLGSIAFAGAVFVAVEALQSAKRDTDNWTKAVQAGQDVLADFGKTTTDAANRQDFLSAAFKASGFSTKEVNGLLASLGLTTQDLADQIEGTNTAQGHYVEATGRALEAGGKQAENANQLNSILSQVSQIMDQSAHNTLSAAVASGELGRADEVAAIKAHTLTDGHVDWLGVLRVLRPEIAANSNQVDEYGNKLAVATKAVKDQADAQQTVASATLFNLSGIQGITAAQVEQAIALHTSADGAIDYASALKDVDPAAAAVAQDIATIATGLDNQATRFKLAQDQAALYKEQFDQLVKPTLDADAAQIKFRTDLDAMLDPFQKAADAADAYAKTTKEIVDSTLDAEGANIKLFDAIDNVNKTLAANKGVADEKTKAGRDDQQAIIDLVKAYDAQIEAEIRSGASTDQIKKVRNEEITNLQQLAGQFPGLRGQINQYIGVLNAANAKEQDTTAVTDAHHQKLIDLINAGDEWIQTLIKTGAPQEAISQARADEIIKLENLKKQYPELGTVIDAYITKLQGIPPQKDTIIKLHNVEESEAQLANIHTAIDELRDKHVSITAVTIDAQLAFDELTGHINASDFALLTLEQQIELVNRAFANSPFATAFGSQPGEPGFQGGRMAGGPIWPGTWDVGENGPERLTITSFGLGVVTPKSPATQTATASGINSEDLNRIADRILAGLQTQRPIQVFEAVHPDATAAAIDQRLGQQIGAV